MTARERRIGSLVCGAGGALLIAALFLPWASLGPAEESGWDLLSTLDGLLLITGLIAVAAAVTGGGIGLFRPDLSIRGAADLLGVVSTGLLVWFLFFRFPGGADLEAGAFLALAGAVCVAFGAADYGTLRGDPVFPRLNRD